jgi:hypothetical protein
VTVDAVRLPAEQLLREELARLCLLLLELHGRPVPDGGSETDRLAAVVASGRR